MRGPRAGPSDPRAVLWFWLGNLLVPLRGPVPVSLWSSAVWSVLVLRGPGQGPQDSPGISGSGLRLAQPQLERARIVARRLAAVGKPVSRRALRSGGVKGSNEALSALAHIINAERAGVPAAGENIDR